MTQGMSTPVNAGQTRSRHTLAMVDGQSTRADVDAPSPASRETDREFGDLRHYVPADLLDVSFPVAVRGYERGAVDAYTRRVNRIVAELKVSASPTAAVRHALDQAGEKVDGLLRSAQDAAEQITTSAREEAEENADRIKSESVKFLVDTNAEVDRVKAEADEFSAKVRSDAEATLAKAKEEASEILAKSQAEAQDTLARSQAQADERRRQVQEELARLQEDAETRLREIKADTQAVWRERDQMLDNIREMANDLVDIARTSVGRLQSGSRTAPDNSSEGGVGTDDDGPTVIAAPESASEGAAARKRGSSGKSARRD
jgi:F0F1-type ATP synthase membrane subunit b/b'